MVEVQVDGALEPETRVERRIVPEVLGAQEALDAIAWLVPIPEGEWARATSGLLRVCDARAGPHLLGGEFDFLRAAPTLHRLVERMLHADQEARITAEFGRLLVAQPEDSDSEDEPT